MTSPGVSLFGLMLASAYRPLVGVARRWPNVAHAVPIESISAVAKQWPKVRTVHAACGRRVAVVYPMRLWAPRVRGTDGVRCPDCVAIHGARVPTVPKWMRAPEVAA